MATVSQMRERLKSVNLIDEALSIVSERQEQVLSLQKMQMKTGRGKKLRTLKKYRNPDYSKKKNQMNPAPGLGNPDLYLTGNLYSSLRVVINRDGWYLDSNVPYFFDLAKIYSEEELELFLAQNPETRAEMIAQFFQRDIIEKIRGKLMV